jgi:hypothetical protein
MSARIFSILRRRPGIIDFITPIQPPSSGVVGYRLKTDASQDPSGAFATTIMTKNLYGYEDPDVRGMSPIQPGEHVRIVFKPQNFSLTDAAFWLKLVFVNASNAEMGTPAPSAPTLVLPPFDGPVQTGFNSTAPSGTDITQSLRIDLPRAMDNFRLRTIGSPSIYLAFQEGGPEIIVPTTQEGIGFDGLVTSFWVRGSGGSSAFSATFRYANPR